MQTEALKISFDFTDTMGFQIKKDKYKHARGAYSRILSLFCRVCGGKIMTYQKDGPGSLRRLYFDRIFSPKRWSGLESKSLNAVPPLSCPRCKEEIGVPYIYKKENRKAFKIFQDALVKKLE